MIFFKLTYLNLWTMSLRTDAHGFLLKSGFFFKALINFISAYFARPLYLKIP